ncbi:putative ABC transport system ATP-binding protein [Rhodoblastus acidophilus]|uniref:ABC transporter ATP-binding protein n=1 Tax=Rhodoblastus acidophilus TaxID=1074 RepID=UPI0022240294|nr:ABC transporter ATP-binding protein [Rhodoblastus acidophilus]MCW2284698.1 putative ABC transport system ATP-binding protein [Rhodoblastus acidophilus]MCW2333651.1 putative ABC transport system ATP-binding protein [Rhodoblastus acidophilus]
MTVAAPALQAPEAASAAQKLLRVSRLTKTYETPQGRIPVLRGVDLALARGESMALMGESGSGKSTLLHLVGGLDAADSGEIVIDGVEVTKLSDGGRAELRRETLAVVFQQFNLIPSLTIRANVAFQARLAGRFDAAWTDELIRRLGLEKLLERYPEQLSGGQQQRAAIGRALAVRPRLLLADEPTGNLDEATADEFMALALDVVAATGCGFLMVTHSERLAAKLQQRVRLSSGVIDAP